ncbi:Arc family DNA-binding protein [Rhizobium leguminosarum]|uniref:Arc family DNA-binding protein n=1 Tax=Rhizobium leguminosarum TaxID=384 RepID=UPI001C9203AE|nr:Arc family DNA-binding protein [Rhizobium leguminosarum]MBY2916175.1 Arc family DNA-binding protein [Rhizobium leguminosarum]MBY2971410.1 Arc family DNA-binding protein [Rhizobium leguminosarum]MBY2978812.1 Arc family DNA-binding protein [Rhizobium leguminosarum]MBY3007363.1 Arc family DNA-binding protein [Rhizobium leguminosarum]
MMPLHQAQIWLHYEVMPKKSDNDIPVANLTPFGLRMQPGLKRQMEEAARLSGRSLNSEIVSRLEASLLQADDSREIDTQIRELIDGHEQRIIELEEKLKELVQSRLIELVAKMNDD